MKKPPYKDFEKILDGDKYEKYIKDNLDSSIYKSDFESKFDDLYAGPRKEDDFWPKRGLDEKPYYPDASEARLAEKRTRQLKAYRAKVGCVITQSGLEGALVLEHVLQPDTISEGYFKIRLRSGTITTGTWDRVWAHGSRHDPPGLTSCGWTVGDIKPEIDDDEVPF